MSRSQSRQFSAGAKASGSPPKGAFGMFYGPSTGSNLSYLTEVPNFSTISDANIVVSFKNVLKKDSTTKAKGLEDIITYVQAHPFEHGGIEESILEAWVQVYPRTAVDNARRVRELAHALQFEMMVSARKRMERRIPTIVGSWLAGTFDRDRPVAKAASDGLSSFLSTDDKVQLFWRKCQSQILAYATAALLETPYTLSDERSTSQDDAETKYHRVITGALSLVLGLVQKLNAAEIATQQEAWDQLLGSEGTWKGLMVGDSSTRRTALQLLWSLLDNHKQLIEGQLSHLGKILVSEGLKSNQTGSAADYVQVLAKLSATHPEIWESKKHPYGRLRKFVEKGSQGSSATFWKSLDQLLATVEQPPITLELASDTLSALRTGISGRDEPRSNAGQAWTCYLHTTDRLLNALASSSDRESLLRKHLFPLTAQYLHPTQELAPFATGSQLPLLVTVWRIIAQVDDLDSTNRAGAEWEKLADEFLVRMANSLPEVSKEFSTSQMKVAEEGKRWFALVGATSHGPSPTSLLTSAETPSRKVLKGAADILSRRNYKPFGLAAIVESALKHAPVLFKNPTVHLLTSLLPKDDEALSEALSSPSARHLMACASALGDIPERQAEYAELWQRLACASMRLPVDQCGEHLGALLAFPNATALAHKMPEVQTLLYATCLKCVQGENDAWGLFERCISSGVLTTAVMKKLLQQLLELLGSSSHQESNLRALEIITTHRPELLSHDCEGFQVDLTAKLLGLMEISDSAVSATANALRLKMENKGTGQASLVGVIQAHLDAADDQSLEIDTLVQKAQIVLQQDATPLEELLPNTNIWMSELQLFLRDEPDPSLSLTSLAGGAFFLVGRNPSPAGNDTRPRRDRNGCSIPARMALYTSKLLASGVTVASLPQELQTELLILLQLVGELASDQVISMSENGLFGSGPEDAAARADHLTTAIRQVADDMVKSTGGFQNPLIDDVVRLLLQQTQVLSPMGLYSARALTATVETLVEAHGPPTNLDEWINGLAVMKAAPSTVLGAIAVLHGLGDFAASSKTIINHCNRLVSDVAGLNAQADTALLTLVLLNACLAGFGLGALPVANNRVVFAVRQITTWLKEAPADLDYRLSAEICKALSRLLPCVKDVYGPYWERTLDFCMYLWSHAGEDSTQKRLPYLQASLKLVSTLDSLHDANDDLEDTLKSHAEGRSLALIQLLQLPRTSASQPSAIVDELLCRQVRKIPLKHIRDTADLYSLLSSESKDTQTAAFDILHRALPAAQEELSFDVLLEKKVGRLPSELLSLLLDAPTLEAYPDTLLAQFPLPIRSYLLSWHLVFDAFEMAAFKLRTDYSDNLKDANHVGPLLDFMFDVLGHSAAHPLNLDREGFTEDMIRTYDVTLADAEPPERNMDWLLVHLFFCVLKYVPSLFKAWILECRSKQTRLAVEAWMSKYISPLITSDVLDEVAAWAASPDAKGDDDTELLVKVLKGTREVTAGYEVDELQASITLRLPPSYPLESVTVVGNSRVAVSERKWQSWLLNTQGVIALSNGNIVDGLVALRRNVSGALKGQSECAICYSIISADKQMPDKECATCHNLFHRQCLYKWFQTSAGNTCPLCRNQIGYLGSDLRLKRNTGLGQGRQF